ncbi:MAG TPA: dihydrolipoamide acetyltransferase family protein, partial [Acidimicrobiales bacterium]|nr:dihydrolipoamide acetyltransferase family protein [Acidimicrobiales bacterium]
REQSSVPGAAAPTSAIDSAASSGLVLSPVVRRLLDENSIDVSEVEGTGVGGRITRADVLAVIDARRSGGAPASAGVTTPLARTTGVAPQPGPTPQPGVAPQPGPTPQPGALSARPGVPTAGQISSTSEGASALAGTDEVVPFTNIRRRTAEHMVRSKATSAHTLVVKEADFEAIEHVRRSLGQRFKEEEGFSLTYLPFVARATIEALRDFPQLNSSVGDDSLVVHHQINLGIAVDLDRQGLIVPVIQRAEELTLRGIARRIHDLAQRARTKKLTADDIAGGTFSITNPGPFGTLLTAPIINQPQVAILSTDGVKRRPVVVELDDGTEAITIRSIGLLSLAWDHRAVDGAYAAAFVAGVAELLTTRDWSTEL